MIRNIFIIFLSFTSCVTASGKSYPAITVNKLYLKEVVYSLSNSIGPRNLDHYKSLMLASEYIQNEFKSFGYKVQLQKYSVFEKEVENVVVSIGPEHANRIVVGAHYDTFGSQPGADDNASGVAGLLALAKLLKEHESLIKKRIDLVAFTLEEPPFFRSDMMGSYIHAKSLHDKKVKVEGMISLEMIGYFSSEEDSQDYPLGLLHLFYPSQGNFIGVVSNMSSGGLKAEFRDSMSNANIPVRSLSAPAGLVGVDFSDHLNYWKFDYDAIMITDTAFYRNKNYHQGTDKLETLDFDKMALVIEGVFYGVFDLVSR